MLGYTVKPQSLSVSVTGGSKASPLRLSANPYSELTGKPVGFVSVDGDVYHAIPEHLPVLVGYDDGGVEIRNNFSLKDVVDARFVVAGSMMLVENKTPCVLGSSTLHTRDTVSLDRMGVGTLHTGELLVMQLHGTTADLQNAFSFFRVYDAMMMAYDNVYINDTKEGIQMGTQPLTVLEAKDYKSLPRPIVVIDAGHGGKDPGAVGFGLNEKATNLLTALSMQRHLSTNFEGTFLLIRDKDTTVELNDRPKMANAVKPDFYFSVHSNSWNIPTSRGFESFTYTKPSTVSEAVRLVVHDAVMQFLKPYGIVDRGKKQANLCVVRETNCPAMLVENLFISNPTENKLLADPNFLNQLAIATANGLAKGLGLRAKLTATTTETPEIVYKVQVGAFTHRKGAEDMMEKLSKVGFSGTIVSEKKKG